jgi:hypothetical protein
MNRGFDMSKLEWRDPSPVQRSAGHLWLVLQQIQAVPGRWAVVGEYGSVQSASAAASRLRSRGFRPEGDWAFTARSLPSGRAELYARYAPEEMNLGR